MSRPVVGHVNGSVGDRVHEARGFPDTIALASVLREVCKRVLDLETERDLLRARVTDLEKRGATAHSRPPKRATKGTR